jgi:hypothetical protein
MSWANCKIELSDDDGSSWIDISGFANSLSIDGGDRQMGEFFTCDGELPIITYGKRNMITITINCVYTEGAADEPYIMAALADEGHNPLLVKWSPAGGGSGDFEFESGPAYITSPVYPQGAADSPDAIALDIALSCGAITRATVT